MLELFEPCRGFIASAAIEADDILGAEPLGGAQAVHGHVARADHRHVVAEANGGVEIGESEGLHEVDAGQELVGREHADVVLAGDAHEVRQTGAGAEEDCVETVLREQLLDARGLTDDEVAADLDTELLEVADLVLDDFLGQPELGDAVDQHAAGLVQRLVDSDLVAAQRKVGGAGETRRPRTDHCDLESASRRQLGHLDVSALSHLPIGNITLEPADGDGIALLAGHTDDFALVFLWADATADGRQGVVLLDNGESTLEVRLLNLDDKPGDVDVHGATVDTLWFLALETAVGFDKGEIL